MSNLPILKFAYHIWVGISFEIYAFDLYINVLQSTVQQNMGNNEITKISLNTLAILYSERVNSVMSLKNKMC